MKRFTIILPLYNDWKSLSTLLNQIGFLFKKSKYFIDVLLINDSSSKINRYKLNQKKIFKSIKIINLKKNIGSQRAIATGIKYINENKKKFSNKFIILDSDGEDDPKKIIDILHLIEKNKNIKVITLNRALRKESLFFSILYELHLFITFLFTFNYIRFGNFTFIDSKIINKISKKNDLWLAYAATLNKFFRDRKIIIAPRKKRISGKSKMSYFNLLVHSLKIQSVYKKNIFFSYFIYSILMIFFISFGLSLNLAFFFIFVFIVHIIIINYVTKNNNKEITFKNCLNNVISVKNYK